MDTLQETSREGFRSHQGAALRGCISASHPPVYAAFAVDERQAREADVMKSTLG